MARIIAKKHVRDGSLTLALCDESILGQVFTENFAQLDLRGSFYAGELIEEQKIAHLVEAARSIHVAGTDAVEIVRKIVPDLHVKKIAGVPFSVIIKLI